MALFLSVRFIGTPNATVRVWTRAAARSSLAAIVLVLAAAPQTASARWTRISARPSRTEPYFVCSSPPASRHRQARCDAIEDPTRGSSKRGPVGEGDITSGPDTEASPELSGEGVEGGYSPQNLRDAYDLPSSTAGAGQTVAIIDAYDDPHAEADLDVYRSHYGITECTASGGCFRKINQTGGSSLPPANAEWASEISVDLDMVSAICSACHIVLVEANSAEESDLAAAENEAVAVGATEISNSFGFPETSSEPEYAAAYDHPGIPTTAAAGDDGYGVQTPAANPDVIAVGGTELLPASNSRGWKETVWGKAAGGEGSGTGSGCTEEPKPTWQTDADCPYRTMNDVAAVADPNTPVSVYDSYDATKSAWRLLGGTSAATPIIAAAMALANPHTRSFEGAEALYLEAEINGTGVLDNVVKGENGNCGNYLCKAEVGYNGPTGLGSLEGAPEVPAPTFATGSASSVTATTATLSATIDPNGSDMSECRFEYGTTSSYGSSAPCTKLPGSGINPTSVSASLAGLDPKTVYHFRITADYPGGSGAGKDATFTTLGAAPTVVADGPSGLTQSSATLDATVDPNGTEVTKCEFEYGSSTSYGTSVACTPSPGGGHEALAVSASLTALQPHTTYHFRISATNAEGTSHSNDETFQTLETLPAVTTEPASEVTQTSATLKGTVDPNSESVGECWFEYGTSTAYESSTRCTRSLEGGHAPVAVSTSITGLQANTTYHYRLVATNAEGWPSYGGDETSKTLVATDTAPGGENTTTSGGGGNSNGGSLVSSIGGDGGLTLETVPPAGQSELAGRTLAASSTGSVSVPVRCRPEKSTCEGSITLRTLEAVGSNAGARQETEKHIVTLARGTFKVAGGKVTVIKLRLAAGIRRLLARTHTLRASATITARAIATTAHTIQTVVTIRLHTR